MKKNLILSLLTGVTFFALLSFTIYKETSKTTAKKTVAVNNNIPKSFSCVAQVTNLHIISHSGGNITFGWSYTGSPASFNYGGYYQLPPPGTFAGSTTALQVTISDHTSRGPGGRFGVLAICSDGSSSGTSINMLW